MVKMMSTEKKEIQKRRMMRYFIEAATEVIEKEGLEAVTVRKVADMAGYNSATLYNYFENLEHLIFFASMKYLKEYALALPHYLKNHKNALDQYLRVWKCFSYYAFSNPKIYNIIFFESYNNYLMDIIEEYCAIFPEELIAKSKDLISMYLGQNIYEGNKHILKACVKEGCFEEKYLDEINEMTLFVFQGVFSKFLHQQVESTIEEAVNKTLNYICRTLKAYGCEEI